MGSVTFDSQDGSSRVHDHVATDIRFIKSLLPEDEDVILSLGRDFLEDFTWIAGEDRAYFAARLRSVLASDPPGEWSFRGLNQFDTPEALSQAAEWAKTGDRVPGLHSIIEHLETSSEHPVVITNSVSAHFPSMKYWPPYAGRPKAEPDEDDDYEFLKEFEGLSESDRWKAIWPEFLKDHANKRWRRGATASAAKLRSELKAVGFWRQGGVSNSFEDEIFASTNMDDLTKTIRSAFVGFAVATINDLASSGTLYVVGEESIFRAACEPIARKFEDRLGGIGNADVRIAYCGSEVVGRLETYHLRGYAETAPEGPVTKVVCVPILASADILLKLVETVIPDRSKDPVIIVAGLANGPQAQIAVEELAKVGRVQLRAADTVDFDLTGVWKHVNRLRYSRSAQPEPISKWLMDRQARYYGALRGAKTQQVIGDSSDGTL